MKNFNLQGPEIKSKDAVNLSKNELISLFICLHFEMEFQTSLLKHLDVLKYDSLYLLVIIVLISLENEELVAFEFILDQLLSTDDSKIVFILTLLHRKYFSSFSRLWCKQFDR